MIKCGSCNNMNVSSSLFQCSSCGEYIGGDVWILL